MPAKLFSTMEQDPADLPRLQPSCSPDSNDSPTRWQKLRTLVQTKSLMPADPNSAIIPAFASRHPTHMHNSALNHFATVTKPRQKPHHLRHDAAGTDRARATLLFEPEIEPGPVDSLETDLQVEAVLRKATARAARMAGLPQAPPCQSTLLAGLAYPSNTRVAPTAGYRQVLNTVQWCNICIASCCISQHPSYTAVYVWVDDCTVYKPIHTSRHPSKLALCCQ